jgi:hypothetical protein
MKQNTFISRTTNVSTYNITIVACHILRVSTAAVTQHAMRTRHIVTCGLTGSAILPHIIS